MLKDLSQYLHLKKTTKQAGREEFVSSWKHKICAKIHEEPSGLSLNTQLQVPCFLLRHNPP